MATKLKCKECHKQLKINNRKELKTVDCENTNCSLKYDMSVLKFDFSEFKFPEATIIEQWENKKPESSAQKELSVEEWEKLLEETYCG